LRLTLADVDADQGVVRIRESKFHKSRTVPLSPDASRELRVFLRKRLRPPLSCMAGSPLLCNPPGGCAATQGPACAKGSRRCSELPMFTAPTDECRASTTFVITPSARLCRVSALS
jgi:integrase